MNQSPASDDQRRQQARAMQADRPATRRRRASSTACSSTVSPRPKAWATSPVVPERRKLKVAKTMSKMMRAGRQAAEQCGVAELADHGGVDQADQRRRQIGERHRHGDRQHRAVVDDEGSGAGVDAIQSMAPLRIAADRTADVPQFHVPRNRQPHRRPTEPSALAQSRCRHHAAADRPPSRLRRRFPVDHRFPMGKYPALMEALRARGLTGRSAAPAGAGAGCGWRSRTTPPTSSRSSPARCPQRSSARSASRSVERVSRRAQLAPAERCWRRGWRWSTASPATRPAAAITPGARKAPASAR